MIRGVLGGSFDPVHDGHLAMARHILTPGHCHHLHVVPAFLSPHKKHSLATAEQRLAMTRLAFQGQRDITVDDREVLRPGPSFTVDTLISLQEEFPEDSLLLVVGQDSWTHLATWKDPAQIFRLATVAVLDRPDHQTPLLDPDLSEHPEARYFKISDFRHPVSSTRIRAMLAGDSQARAEALEFIPSAVGDYIQQHALYL